MQGTHPVLACASSVTEAIEDVAGLEPGFMRTAEKEAALVALTRAADQLAALRLRVLAAADDVAAEHGTRDAGVWLAHATRGTRPALSRELRLAAALERHAPVAEALAAGDLRVEQAEAICRAVDALPAAVGGRPLESAVREQARSHLLALASEHDARALVRLGRRILDVVAPEVGEAHEAALLEREETGAAAAASFTMVDDGRGRCHGRFVLPAHAGAMLRRHLLALANPRRHDRDALTDDTGAWRSMPERLGAALVEYVERYPADHTPASGGVNATVVVTMSLDSLLGGLGPGTLDDGTRISAGTARRLACEAGLVPAVLGSAGQPLDVGRRVRLHTQPQRLALALRDGGCTARGCDLPPAACHAHHDQPWSRGGPTTLANGRLLCPRHHRLAHHGGYDVRRHPDNTVTFHRRT